MKRSRGWLTTTLSVVVATAMIMSVAGVEPAEASHSRAEVKEIRTRARTGYDRLVFDIRGNHPNVTVERTGGVASVTDVKGNTVAMAGSALLKVKLEPATLKSHAGKSTYTGPMTLTPDHPTLKQVTVTADSSGKLRLALGTSAPTGTRVLKLESPTRIVIDVAQPAAATSSITVKSMKEPANYRVVNVAPTATLKVRSEPGGALVTTLPHNATNIRTTGNRAEFKGETWHQIWLPDRTGWVKGSRIQRM